MAYYFASYYTSGLDGPAYVARLHKALSGKKDYGGEQSLCLYFEASCRNERLNGLLGNVTQWQVQAAWLQGELARRPLPALSPR